MSFIGYLVECYLKEDVIDNVTTDFNLPKEVVQHYYDHALDKSDKSQRALQFVVGLHKKGAIVPEQAPEIKSRMAVVSRSNLKGKLKDVKTFDDLKSITEPHMEKSVSKKEQIDHDSPVVFENDHVKITQHKTHDSAIKGALLHPDNPMFSTIKGKGQWCVSADSDEGKEHFDDYTDNGKHPLYTIFNKHTKRKYALVANPHTDVGSMELRDEKDEKPTGDEYESGHTQLHSFVTHNPGLEGSIVDKHFENISPEYKDLKEKLPIHATKDQILASLKHKDSDVTTAAGLHANVDSDILHHIIKSNHVEDTITATVLKTANITPDHSNEVLKTKSKVLIHGLAQNPRLDSNSISKILDTNDTESHVLAMKTPNVTKEHIDRVLDPKNNFDGRVKKEALGNPVASKEQIEHAVYNSGYDPRLINGALRSKHITPVHIHHILTKHDDVHNKVYATIHANATPENLTTAQRQYDMSISKAVMFNRKANEQHIQNALEHAHSNVRQYAVKHKNATLKNLQYATNDDDKKIADMAKKRIAAKDYK